MESKAIGGKGGAELAKLVDGLDRWAALTRGPRVATIIDDDAVLDDGPQMRSRSLAPLK